jgi:glycosyltransferase involved in cell wall biosynthesis
MRVLPALPRRRPNAHILIVGGEGVSYGAKPAPRIHGAAHWKTVFIAEVRPQIPDADWARVHFLGHRPYPQFIALLQLSRVHVYLTYPFVLSWSLLEAMSCGGAIVASDTAPVREAIQHDVTGRLVDFFASDALTDAVCTLLDDPAARTRLGQNARAFARTHYDLHRVCLPQHLAWVQALADGAGLDARPSA